MKKKILFYGNCQAAGLAKILSFHEDFLDKYEIIPKGRNLPGHIQVNESIAHHKLRNIKNQWAYQEKWKIVEEKLKQTDILIHHALSGEREVCMDYVYQNFPNIKKFIKIPTHYFTGYLHGGKIPPQYSFIKDAVEHCKYNPKKTVKFLKNDYMPKWGEWMEHMIEKNYDSMLKRAGAPDCLEKERFIYIESADYVKDNCRLKCMNYMLLHPTHFVFDHWLKQICKHLRIKPFIFKKPMAACVAGPGGSIWPGHFKFFKSEFFDDSFIDSVKDVKWKWGRTCLNIQFEKKIEKTCMIMNSKNRTRKRNRS